MRSLRIGEVAKQADVGIETIRYYERQGLLAEPDRRPSGYRQYDESVVARLQFIRRAKELGFTLAEIKELLGLWFDVRRSASTSGAGPQKIADIEDKNRSLQKMKRSLKKILSQCENSVTRVESVRSGGLDEPRLNRKAADISQQREESMKRLWIGFASGDGRFLSRPGLDRHSHLSGSAADSVTRWSRPTARWSSTPVRLQPGKTSGNRWAAWKSARSGDTAAMSPPTGPPIGCIEKPSSSSTAGPTSDFGNDLREARRRTAGPIERSLGNAHADQHLRSGHADGHGRPDSGRGVSSRTSPTTRTCSPTARPTTPFLPEP